MKAKINQIQVESKILTGLEEKIKKIVEKEGYVFIEGGKIEEENLRNFSLGEITYEIDFGGGEKETFQFISDNKVVHWLTYYSGEESIKNLQAAVWLYNSLKSKVLERINDGNSGNNPHYHIVMASALEKYITALLNFVLYKNPHKQEFNHELFEEIGLYKGENWRKLNEISLVLYGKTVDPKLTEENFKKRVKYIGVEETIIREKIPIVYKCEEDKGSHIEIVEKVRYEIVEKTVYKEVSKEAEVLELNGEILENPLKALEDLSNNLEYSNLRSPFKDVSDREYQEIIKKNIVPALALYLNLYHGEAKLPVIPPKN